MPEGHSFEISVYFYSLGRPQQTNAYFLSMARKRLSDSCATGSLGAAARVESLCELTLAANLQLHG
jgi:hypothetical protein